MIRGLYEGDIRVKQLLENFLRVNISKIQAQQNSEIRLLVHVIMTKIAIKVITRCQRTQKVTMQLSWGCDN